MLGRQNRCEQQHVHKAQTKLSHTILTRTLGGGGGADILYWQFSLTHLAILATHHMSLCLKAVSGLTLTTSVTT